jgi:hypothetical protein
MCQTTIATTTTGSRITWNVYICPKSRALKNEPIPTELRPSLPCVAIHCESKFCCDR